MMNHSTTDNFENHHQSSINGIRNQFITRFLITRLNNSFNRFSEGGQILFLITGGIARLLSIVLVLIFAVAAANKASNFAEFTAAVSSQGIIHTQLVPVFSAALILFEFILAGWLLLSLLQNYSLRLPLIAMGFTFIFFFSYALVMVNKPDAMPVSSSCGCGLPSVLKSTTGVWQGVMIRNGIFIGIAVVALFLDWFSRHDKRLSVINTVDHQSCEELS